MPIQKSSLEKHDLYKTNLYNPQNFPKFIDQGKMDNLQASTPQKNNSHAILYNQDSDYKRKIIYSSIEDNSTKPEKVSSLDPSQKQGALAQKPELGTEKQFVLTAKF